MAELTKIEYAMDGKTGVQAIQRNFEEINTNLPQSAEYILRMSDVPTESKSKVSSVQDSRLNRYGNIVTMYSRLGANTSAGATPVLNIPKGFTPVSGGAMGTVAIQQSSGDANKYAYTAGKPVQLFIHGIDGNVNVAGSWMTQDDFPE